MTGELARASNDMVARYVLQAAAIVASAGMLCTLLIVALHPLLERYALVRPNARSSHKIPTPQGGGIAVVVATVMTAGSIFYASGTSISSAGSLPIVFAAVILIACVGVMDDIRPIEVTPRLLSQALAVLLAVYALPEGLRVLPMLPWWLERLLLIVAGLWFVNLVNFMDGLDWMTVAEVLPVTVALALMASLDALPREGAVISLSLCGAMLGFSYFNRPVAKLFLGDVGSLPVGLLVGWLLLLLAARGHLVAAILLPLYYLADATITLFRRLIRGEQIWQAHRFHFYQRATDHGFTVIEVVGWVFAVNIALAALAVLTIIEPSKLGNFAALLGGAALVTILLFAFARGKK
jgi:UDP-N-acetylmuramyl pentapeptide phosphotransferase/UDP-N-acetylglucosamine-1-phosphate transferase